MWLDVGVDPGFLRTSSLGGTHSEQLWCWREVLALLCEVQVVGVLSYVGVTTLAEMTSKVDCKLRSRASSRCPFAPRLTWSDSIRDCSFELPPQSPPHPHHRQKATSPRNQTKNKSCSLANKMSTDAENADDNLR